MMLTSKISGVRAGKVARIVPESSTVVVVAVVSTPNELSWTRARDEFGTKPEPRISSWNAAELIPAGCVTSSIRGGGGFGANANLRGLFPPELKLASAEGRSEEHTSELQS